MAGRSRIRACARSLDVLDWSSVYRTCKGGRPRKDDPPLQPTEGIP